MHFYENNLWQHGIIVESSHCAEPEIQETWLSILLPVHWCQNKYQEYCASMMPQRHIVLRSLRNELRI